MALENEAVLILHRRGGEEGRPYPTPSLLSRLALARPELLEDEGGGAYVFRAPREAGRGEDEGRDWAALQLCADLRSFARRIAEAGLPGAARVCGLAAEMVMASAIADYLAPREE